MRVETGRHTVPKTPENLRICSFCHSDEVENEYHFLFSCTFYEEIRKKIYLEIHDKYSHFNSLDNTSKILFLFSSVDPFICRSSAAFVFECMTAQNESQHIISRLLCLNTHADILLMYLLFMPRSIYFMLVILLFSIYF